MTTMRDLNQRTEATQSQEDGLDSSDEALCEMLGLTSIETINDDENDGEHQAVADSLNSSKNSTQVPRLSQSYIDSVVNSRDLQNLYETESICVFPRELGVPVQFVRRITDELVWGGDKVKVDRTYETIKIWKRGVTEERRTLTRLENFVNFHNGWRELCHGHLAQCISAMAGTEMVLYKEKLNLKPPGGSGFAPHLDTPSLRVALGESGPQSFVTVMVAIDDMTAKNGCLRVYKGAWSEVNHCSLVPPEQDGNPDAGGRAGAIPLDAAESMEFEDIFCKGGDVVAFNGWAPHRSAANTSPFPRRAVFLTYNPKSEGDFHDRYYERMEELRSNWRQQVGLTKGRQQLSADEQSEMDALATIPRI